LSFYAINVSLHAAKTAHPGLAFLSAFSTGLTFAFLLLAFRPFPTRLKVLGMRNGRA
jgi:hypothetical protein